MDTGNKLIIAITGASGSIYSKILLEKLSLLETQWEEIGVVMSQNAKQVWETELGNKDYEKIPFRQY
ncbi:MAG: 3-octaprenyl-4-hydroxybenzoate carboxy-lyase, partial [Bacteroidia bacterium]|nr:3-octaprenyl-4-hydroxybenzoate carboxy-lyase [Bacteroidia bacterium]